MDYDAELKRLMRQEKKLQNLDADEPRCGVCGNDEPKVLEKHHVAGRANSELTVWLCRNHHAIASDMQEDLVPDLRRADPERDPLLTQAAMLRGVAILLIIVAIALLAWSQWNIQASTGLTNQYGADWYKSISAEVPK